MFSEYSISEMPLGIPHVRKEVEGFLGSCGLKLEDVDCWIAALNGEGDIVAGAGLSRDIIKCVAVSESARGTGIANTLISNLISRAQENGHTNIKVFTKPSNQAIFESLGFRTLATSDKAILLENGNGLDKYLSYLKSLRKDGPTGIIVINANPLTLGHLHLISTSNINTLYVIVVKEDKSRFKYQERLAMVQEACKEMPNVVVCEGSEYAISAATFPSYFLKSKDEASEAQMALDIDLFARHIAPALGATVRFAGSEPSDALTASYNAKMSELLPKYGIEFREIPRYEIDGTVVSASTVRKALDEGRTGDAARLCPDTTLPYLLADQAVTALKAELDCPLKPGLVGPDSNGAHTDMNYELMLKSINSLRPYFVRLAKLETPDDATNTIQQLANEVKAIGLEAETAMLTATGGINTHRGALYCLGLALACAKRPLFAHRSPKNAVPCANTPSFAHRISIIASQIPAATNTHGAEVQKMLNQGLEGGISRRAGGASDAMLRRHPEAQNEPKGDRPLKGGWGVERVKSYSFAGAREMAIGGYKELFSDWLPYYRSLEGDEWRLQKTLLRIISELDDTNVIYRKGPEVAAEAKKDAKALIGDFSPEKLSHLCKKFTAQGISPGGAADMLALTIFINNILNF